MEAQMYDHKLLERKVDWCPNLTGAAFTALLLLAINDPSSWISSMIAKGVYSRAGFFLFKKLFIDDPLYKIPIMGPSIAHYLGRESWPSLAAKHGPLIAAVFLSNQSHWLKGLATQGKTLVWDPLNNTVGLVAKRGAGALGSIKSAVSNYFYPQKATQAGTDPLLIALPASVGTRTDVGIVDENQSIEGGKRALLSSEAPLTLKGALTPELKENLDAGEIKDALLGHKENQGGADEKKGGAVGPTTDPAIERAPSVNQDDPVLSQEHRVPSSQKAPPALSKEIDPSVVQEATSLL